jgi:hypothetical protein
MTEPRDTTTASTKVPWEAWIIWAFIIISCSELLINGQVREASIFFLGVVCGASAIFITCVNLIGPRRNHE